MSLTLLKDSYSISEARKRIFDIANEVQVPERVYTLTADGKPKAVIMSAEEYESWMETMEVLSDPKILEKIKFVLASLFLGAAWGIFEIGLVLFSDQKVLSAFRSGNPQVIFSFGTIVALHTLTAFLMGTFISSNNSLSKLRHIQIILFPILLHILFNFLIIQKGNFTDFLTVAALAIGYLVGLAILAFNFKRLA